ncbi:hypothetical protein SteCoe_9476 [Stentor coeruleus]|uniref:Uncharacterized protein n=1 Tax=Stentor coeruleus TaxID=5963 RepID=A0A1R2CHU8_9CILI|nr:hypothetical protein SteCoe_9476 [Stentor coeruleus]
MEIPAKRINSNKRAIQSIHKRPKTELLLKSILKSIYLRKELWIEIIDYLDTKTYFCIISQINSFFYSLVKNCKNYRTSLNICLLAGYSVIKNSFRFKIIKNSKGMDYILNCQQLNKLEIKLKYVENQNANAFQSRLNFTSFLFPMIELKSIKILKLRIGKLFFIERQFYEEIESILNILENIEVLKICLNYYFTRQCYSILSKCIKSYQNQRVFPKKLSISYCDQIDDTIDDLLESLNDNNGLEKFSMKNNGGLGYSYKMTKFLKENYCLKILKLPYNIFFNETSARDLCSYLAYNNIIEELQVNDSLLISLELFIDTILINKSLKILVLLNLNKDDMYKVNIDDLCKILNSLAYTLIEKFSITSFINKNINKNCLLTQEEIGTKMDNFLTSLDFYLSTSQSIKNIKIDFYDLPLKYVSPFADLIIKHVKLGRIEYFSGQNLKMLIENKIEILELVKNNERYKYFSSIEILCEIYRRYLVNADKIVKIIEKKKFKNIIVVEEFIKNVALSKRLKLNTYKKSIPCPLYYFSLIILSVRAEQIIELNIKNTLEIIYNFALLELLKEFKSLQILKFEINDRFYLKKIFINLLKTVNSSLNKISFIECCLHKNLSVKLNKIFTDSVLPKSLKKLKFKSCQLLLKGCKQNKNMNNFMSNHTLTSLTLSEIALSTELIDQLAEGLKENQTITHLKFERFSLINKKGYFENNPKIQIDLFLLILSSLDSKTNFEKLTLYFPYGNLMKKDTTDDIAEKFLADIKNLLNKNKKLKEFNVFLDIPSKYLLEYSDILLDSIQKNTELKVVNFFNIDEIVLEDNKTCHLASEYFHKDMYREPKSKTLQKLIKKKKEFDEYMAIVLSELLKNNRPLIFNKLIKTVFGKKTLLNNKRLDLVGKKKSYRGFYIYKYNFIEIFSLLEEITISNSIITLEAMIIIEKNLQKLEHLHTIKILKNIYITKDISGFFGVKHLVYFKILIMFYFQLTLDISGFFGAKHLVYFKILDNVLFSIDFNSFSNRMKNSSIENFTFINFAVIGDENYYEYFKQLFKAFSCNSLKKLKISIAFTPIILNLLIRKLFSFKILESLTIPLQSNYESYKISIKTLISVVKNKQTKLNRIKIHKYIWDIEKLMENNRLEFNGCQFCPGDLMILAELCEEKFFKNVKCVDLSDNREVVDDNFVKNITRIIKAIKCSEIVLKNSRCNEKHVEEIKNILGKNKISSLSLVLS